jgi:precorrin-6Y C5,15-methyltransferase (decarboxylating)
MPAITVVGLVGGESFGDASRRAIDEAEVLVGATRYLASTPTNAMTVELTGPLPPILDQIADHRDTGRRVTVLASGDPGFFGIVRTLGDRFGTNTLVVHPAPSTVALAFAAVGRPWDDAVVASAHGRPLEPAVHELRDARNAAVLTSPENPPEAVGKALLGVGAAPRAVAVVSRLGEVDEAIVRTDLDGLAAGTFPPLSVVLLLGATSPRRTLRWGRPETDFEHRNGMITKAEVRAVALGKLALPTFGVLWDLGTGSGSIAVEVAGLAPGLQVHAVDRDPDQVARVRANAEAHRVAVDAVLGEMPDVLDQLPEPDRVFVGGGGLDALDAALARLRPGGVVVATYALVDGAVAAHDRLGSLVQINVSRGAPLAGLGVRLEAENPVFVCWGPS